jgi:hypothetical protein
LRLGQVGFNGSRGSPIPRLDGAFCGVGVTIDDLKVWQPPKVEQLRPTQISMFAPHPKKRNAVVNLSAFP